MTPAAVQMMVPVGQMAMPMAIAASAPPVMKHRARKGMSSGVWRAISMLTTRSTAIAQNSMVAVATGQYPAVRRAHTPA